jgi:hypothetical protein
MTSKFKTAEEWMNSFGKFPNNNQQEAEIYKQVKLPESLLPKVNFWNSVVTESDIETIQANAMREAARICLSHNNSGEGSECYRAIEAIANQIDKGEYKPV